MSQFNWKSDEASFVEVGGKKLEAICFGPSPAEASTIVMLHEGLGCIELWRGFPQKLAEETGYGVFVYSRAGYGKSDACELPSPLDYMTKEAMEILPNVLDAFGFQQGFLLGHSDGATIAAIYAGMVADYRVRAVAMMAPHFFTEEISLKSISDAKDKYDNGDLRDKLTKYHVDVDCAFRGWNDAWLHPDFKKWNVSDTIDHLRIPALAIQGREDEYGTLAQIDEVEVRTYSPADVEIIDNCGHSPHIDQPEKTLAIISEFAARLKRIEDEKVAVA